MSLFFFVLQLRNKHGFRYECKYVWTCECECEYVSMDTTLFTLIRQSYFTLTVWVNIQRGSFKWNRLRGVSVMIASFVLFVWFFCIGWDNVSSRKHIVFREYDTLRCVCLFVWEMCKWNEEVVVFCSRYAYLNVSTTTVFLIV